MNGLLSNDFLNLTFWPKYDNSSIMNEFVNNSDYLKLFFGNLLSGKNDCYDANELLRDMLPAINAVDMSQHWIIRLIFTSLYTMLWFVGVAINVTAIVYIHKRRNQRRRHSATTALILNLMVADLLLCFTSVPTTPIQVFMKKWIFGKFMCKFSALTKALSVFVCSWSYSVLAFDKYLHIVDRVRPATKHFTAVGVAITVWLFSAITSVPYMIVQRYIGDGKALCGAFCMETWKDWEGGSFRQLYGTFIATTQFILPNVLVAYCYWRIHVVVERDSMVKNKRMAADMTPEQLHRAKERRKRVHKRIIAAVSTFTACWMPMTVVNLINDFELTQPSFICPYLLQLFVHFIAMTVVFWNPLLVYWATHQRGSTNGGSSDRSGRTYTMTAAHSFFSLNSMQKPTIRSQSSNASGAQSQAPTQSSSKERRSLRSPSVCYESTGKAGSLLDVPLIPPKHAKTHSFDDDYDLRKRTCDSISIPIPVSERYRKSTSNAREKRKQIAVTRRLLLSFEVSHSVDVDVDSTATVHV